VNVRVDSWMGYPNYTVTCVDLCCLPLASILTKSPKMARILIAEVA